MSRLVTWAHKEDLDPTRSCRHSFPGSVKAPERDQAGIYIGEKARNAVRQVPPRRKVVQNTVLYFHDG